MNTLKYSAAGGGIATRLRTGRCGFQILVWQVVIIFFEKSRPNLGPPTSYSVGTGIMSQRSNYSGVKLITQLHLVPRLRRMSGGTTPLPVHAFLTQIGITFTFLSTLVHSHCYGWHFAHCPPPSLKAHNFSASKLASNFRSKQGKFKTYSFGTVKIANLQLWDWY